MEDLATFLAIILSVGYDVSTKNSTLKSDVNYRIKGKRNFSN